MAAQILSNKPYTSAVIHVTPANTTLIVAGNTSISDIATGDEELTAAYVTQVIWGTDGAGHIKLLRGANVVAILGDTGTIDYAGNGMALTKDQTANLVIQFTTANAYCLLEVQKVGTNFVYT